MKWLENETKVLMQSYFDRLRALAEYGPAMQIVMSALDGKEDWAYTAGNELHVNVTGNKDKLSEVWGVLRKLGYETEDHVGDEKVSDKSFRFKKDTVEVVLKFTSSICRRVQVGTEMKEVPVFEIQCE